MRELAWTGRLPARLRASLRRAGFAAGSGRNALLRVVATPGAVILFREAWQRVVGRTSTA